MLTVLEMAESELPDLLKNESDWKTLDVNYHPPRVKRVWNVCGGNWFRISLHKIYPCEKGEALFHPHPWPSAIKILEGGYEMNVGYGQGLKTPPIACTIILSEGSYYEMLNKDGWHSVRPLTEHSYSMMLTGKVWEREEIKSSTPLQTLTDERKKEIFDKFRKYFLLSL